MSVLLKSTEDTSGTSLYTWYYEQSASSTTHPSVDLAFNDGMLDTIEQEWRNIVGNGDDAGEFMQFEERNAPGDDDEEGGETY
jgi:hypothetical protein